MSPTQTQTTPASGNAIIAAVCVVFMVTIGATIGIIVAVDDGARASSLVSIILPSGGTVILGLLALFKLGSVEATLAEVKSQTNDLTNGKMDAKIRAGIADVLADHFIDPASVQQIALDRLTRDLGNVAADEARASGH